jgi:hypothetical protein
MRLSPVRGASALQSFRPTAQEAATLELHFESDSLCEKPHGRCCTEAEDQAQDLPRHRARYAGRGVLMPCVVFSPASCDLR